MRVKRLADPEVEQLYPIVGTDENLVRRRYPDKHVRYAKQLHEIKRRAKRATFISRVILKDPELTNGGTPEFRRTLDQVGAAAFVLSDEFGKFGKIEFYTKLVRNVNTSIRASHTQSDLVIDLAIKRIFRNIEDLKTRRIVWTDSGMRDKDTLRLDDVLAFNRVRRKY